MTELEIVRKLLPCPFACDGKPYRHESDLDFVGAVAIGCSKCGALGPFIDETGFANNELLWAAAEKAWNTRKPEAAAIITELVEALEECADDLEVEVKERWNNQPDGSCHPALQPKLDRDMAPVIRSRAALSRAKGQQRNGK